MIYEPYGFSAASSGFVLLAPLVGAISAITIGYPLQIRARKRMKDPSVAEGNLLWTMVSGFIFPIVRGRFFINKSCTTLLIRRCLYVESFLVCLDVQTAGPVAREHDSCGILRNFEPYPVPVHLGIHWYVRWSQSI
jgi:hypothetical protein